MMQTNPPNTGTDLAGIARSRDPKGDYLFGQFEATAYGDVKQFALLVSSYGNRMALAVQLYALDREMQGWLPYTDITKNLPGMTDLDANEIVVKTIDEHEPLRSPLLSTGLFEDTGKRVQSGFSTFEVWRITSRFIEGFVHAHSRQADIAPSQ